MPLFKKGAYRATVLVQGTRHTLTMTHPSMSPVGLWEAKCLDYNGTTFRAHAKAATKGKADRALAEKLGVLAPKKASKPRAKFLPNVVMHVKASNFNGIAYPARSFATGPALHEVCQFLADCEFKGLRFIPAKPAYGKYRAKPSKWELAPELLQDFWAAVHGDLVGQTLRIIDKTQGDGQALDIIV